MQRLIRPLAHASVFVLGISSFSAAHGDVALNANYAGAGNSFSADALAFNTFTVSGTGTLKLAVPPALSTATGPLTESALTFNSDAMGWSKSVPLQSSPTGSASLRMQDAYHGQTSPAGADGRADDGATLDGQMAGVVENVQVLLTDSANLGTSGVVLSATAAFDQGVFGDIGGIYTPIRVTVTPAMLMGNLRYIQVGSAAMGTQTPINPGFLDGSHPNVPWTLNLSTQYPSSSIDGVMETQGVLSIASRLTMNFGALGTFQKDYDPIENSASASDSFQLSGVSEFIELATALGPFDFDALLQTFASQWGDDAMVRLPISIVGVLPISEQFDMPLNLGFLGVTTADATFNASFLYSFQLDLTLSSIALRSASGGVEAAVNVKTVPEAPAAGLAAAAAALCFLAAAVRRGRLTIFRRGGTM